MDTCKAKHVKDHGNGDISICKLRSATPFTVTDSEGNVHIGAECDYGPLCGTIKTR